MYHLIDGKQLADDIIDAVAAEIIETGVEPQLAVILVGTDPASQLYVKLKARACARAGIAFHKYLIAEDEPEEKIIETIQFLNADPDIDAILIQLPLPKKFNQQRIIDALDYRKDVDGFHKKNIESLVHGKPQKILPGLAYGILKLIQSTGIETYQNKQAVIISKSPEFTTPLEIVLKAATLQVTSVKPTDPNLAATTREADILITAVGQPGCITSDMVREGVIIIDVGISKVGTATVGDVDFKNVAPKTSFITPVPGGVGPMTVAMLLYNALALAKTRRA